MATGRRTTEKQLGRNDEMNPELDDIRSEIGRDANYNATGGTLLTIPTGKVFHLKSYGVYKSAAGVFQIGASTAGGTRRTLLKGGLPASTNYGETGIQGVVVPASTTQAAVIRASMVTGTGFIRIGGLLRSKKTSDTTLIGF